MSKRINPDEPRQCRECGEWKICKDNFHQRKGGIHAGMWDNRCTECRIKKLHSHTYEKRAKQSPKGWKAKAIAAPEGTKWCGGCEKYLPLDSFYKVNGKPISRCMVCEREARNKAYKPKGWKAGVWRGRPMLTEEDKVAKRTQKAHIKYMRSRGYTGPIHTWEEWQKLLDDTGRKCLKCGKPEDHTILTRDHIIPVRDGGTDAIENIQPLCMRCNSKKQCDKTDYR